MRSNFELKAGTSPIINILNDTESLVTQDRSGVVKIWDLVKSGYVNRNEIATNFTGFARAQYITDKSLLVAPSNTSDISVYDLNQNCATIVTLKPPAEDIKQVTSIQVVSLTDDDTYLLVGYESGHLVMFDMKTVKAVHQIKYDFPITTQDYDLQSNRGVLGGPLNVKVHIFGIEKPTLQLYKKDAENIEYIPNDGQRLAGISTMKIRPDKRCLIVGTCDGIIHVHAWKSLRKLATLRDHRGEITDIAFSNGAIDTFKSPLMAVAGSDGNISLWDIYYKFN